MAECLLRSTEALQPRSMVDCQLHNTGVCRPHSTEDFLRRSTVAFLPPNMEVCLHLNTVAYRPRSMEDSPLPREAECPRPRIMSIEAIFLHGLTLFLSLKLEDSKCKQT